MRPLLAEPSRAGKREILELRAGLPLIESDLIGVELPEGDQALLHICTGATASRGEHHPGVSTLVRPHGRPAVALMVDNIEMGQETLAV